MLFVQHVGTLATIQDRGRAGRAHQGVARSGVFDQGAQALANRLVGNASHEAVIEVLLGSLTLVATQACIVAVTGASADVTLNGRDVGQNVALALRADDVLAIGRCTDGLRAYVSLRGGIGGPKILGSRSFDTLGRIGPPPLKVGDSIPSAHSVELTEPWFEPVPIHSRQHVLDADVGPRIDWLSNEARRTLVTATWTVDSSIDRTGVRLVGPLLERPEHLVGVELASEAMIPGAIQVPSGGHPIILGPDCGTTGGYPVVAVVTRASLNTAGQLRPGDPVRIRLV
jgi:biotin-dependent carboxylase-like uncharacterized protein